MVYMPECNTRQRVASADSQTTATGYETTLMFRNLPRGYTKNDLLSVLEQHAPRTSFDFMHVPMEAKALRNLGFAFVNFVDAPTASATWAAMEGSAWPGETRVRKIQIVPAANQGLAANILKYVKTRRAADADDWPLILDKGEEVPLHIALQKASQVQMQDAPRTLSAGVLEDQCSVSTGPASSDGMTEDGTLSTWSLPASTTKQPQPSASPGRDPRRHSAESVVAGIQADGAHREHQMYISPESCMKGVPDHDPGANSDKVFDHQIPSARGVAQKPAAARQLAGPGPDAAPMSSRYVAASLRVDSLLQQVQRASHTETLWDDVNVGMSGRSCYAGNVHAQRRAHAVDVQSDRALPPELVFCNTEFGDRS